MMYLTDLKDCYRIMHTCIGDVGEGKAHDYRRFSCYPPFPWRIDGTDHSKDNPYNFFRICEQNGYVKHVPAAETKETGENITYQQWLEKHQNEPGFVNHMIGGMKKL